MSHSLPTVLEGIVATRREHLAEIRQRIAHVDPARLAPSDRSLEHSLGRRGDNNFIMECKAASPSLGMIREHYEPGMIARIYSRFASGISVLCEPERFGGDYDHLATVKRNTHLPVLCKDFIIDEVQIHAARYFGADAILLMLSVLDDEEYARLHAEADRLGLDVLTEVIDEEEVGRAIKLGARIFGVNHRNLHDLSIDLSRSARLAELIPPGRVIVSESGIRDNATVRRLGGHSYGFLVGSQLTAQADIDLAARELVYGTNKVCGLRSAHAAQAARAAGAIYGGLIFEEASPRNVSRETAQEIMKLEPGLRYVLVSRRTSGYVELLESLHPDEAEGPASEGTEAPATHNTASNGTASIHTVQVHSPFQGSLEAEAELLRHVREELAEYPDLKIWRALNMEHPDAPNIAAALLDQGLCDQLVLDAGDGGTGRSFDWSTIPTQVREHALLAGGINRENLHEALSLGCAGLDLNSGVEYPATDAEGTKSAWAYHKNAAELLDVFEGIRRFSYPSPQPTTPTLSPEETTTAEGKRS